VSLAEFEAAAVELAQAAGEQALTAFRGKLQLEFKGSKQDDPVTILDRTLETFFREELQRRFPSHGVLGEEHAEDIAPDAEYVWVLDPIDGTANFAAGLPVWGISIGLLQRGVPVAGCIFVPVGPGLEPGSYHARAGHGACFETRPVHVLGRQDERGQVMGMPGDYLRAFRVRRPAPKTPRPARALPDARTLGSCTGELVLIASGTLRAGIFIKPSIWDVAAGARIVLEAGGSVLTWQEGRWQPFERFEPKPPAKGNGPPTLRNWGQPLLLGAPDAVERITARLAWHPRLPMRLRKLLGLT
jgi:myo-inositol-1(or 4)-monophosphatase